MVPRMWVHSEASDSEYEISVGQQIYQLGKGEEHKIVSSKDKLEILLQVCKDTKINKKLWIKIINREASDCFMNNNKNRMKDRDKSNATMRKIDPSRYADKGIINGEKIGVHDGKHEKSN